ncbi:MAG: tetratricopeptide repeat protein [Armatimonadota bacterium]|nr:tetratricopeptide repeat protein [Armatimonadota bacterium]MDW8143589.1 tetratricopeptide repeat protein [Armatimonadota bacterium]
MRLTLTSLLLLFVIVPATSQSVTVLILPPPLSPTSVEAQDALTATLPAVWQKVFGKLTAVTFHKDSPSIQRAKREGKLPEGALTNPHEHANELCAIEGAKVALWLRVVDADGKTPQAIEARMLVPVDARFETNLAETPVTAEERKLLSPVSSRTPPTPEMVLSLRLGQWVQEQTKTIFEAQLEHPSVPDLKTVQALIAEGKFDEAIQAISRMIAESPQHPLLYLLLGKAYEGRQRWDDALLEYRRAVQLQPDLLDAWKGIAKAASQRNRWDLVLTAVRQMRKVQSEIEPTYLVLGARAATNLASDAWKRGRDKEAEALRKEAVELDTLLCQSASEPALVLSAVERLQGNRHPELAKEALTKIVSQLPLDNSLTERILNMAWILRAPELVYQFLNRLSSNNKGPVSLSRYSFRIAVSVLDGEAVKLFNQVRNDLVAFDATKLSRDDLSTRLQQVNTKAEQILKIGHSIQPPEPFGKTHARRLLCYELFLQATTLLMEWVERGDDLIRRRAVVLYEFARTELEQAWKEEQRLR